MAEEDKGPSACFLGCFFLLIVMGTSMGVILLALLVSWKYSGLSSDSGLVKLSCSTSYHDVKFSDLQLLNKTSFSFTVVAAVAGALLTIVVLVWIVKNCTESVELSSCTKIFIYIDVSLMLLGAIAPVGHFLTLYKEKSECTFSTFDQSQVLIVSLVAGGLLIIALVVWCVTVCSMQVNDPETQKKYLILQTLKTQNSEKKQARYNRKSQRNIKEQPQSRKYFESANKRDNLHKVREDTKQNIFEPPLKEYVVLSRKEEKERDLPSRRFVPKNEGDNPVTNLHPALSNDQRSYYSRLVEDGGRSYGRIEKADRYYLKKAQEIHYQDYLQNPGILSRHRQGDDYGRDQPRRDYRQRPRRDERYDNRKGRNRSRNNHNRRRKKRDRYSEDEDSYSQDRREDQREYYQRNDFYGRGRRSPQVRRRY